MKTTVFSRLAAPRVFRSPCTTGLPQATPDQETEDLLSQTVTCYTTIHAPEDGDDKKKDDKNAE